MTIPLANRILAVAAWATFAVATHAAPLYKVKDLGTFGGPESDAAGITRGQTIVGFSNTSGVDSHYRAFSYHQGRMTDLGGLVDGGESFATDVNASDQASGYATAADFSPHAVMFADGQVVDIAALRDDFIQSFAYGINAAGHVVGTAGSSIDYTWHAFVYADGQVQLFDSGSMANGINDHDQIIGTYNSTATIFENGRTKSLGTLGGDYSEGSAINDAGMATGWASPPGNLCCRAFLWRDGHMHDLGTLGGWQSQGLAIDREGVVVGWSYLHVLSNPHAFIATHGRMQDLNDLLDPRSGAGWTLSTATGIDNRGHIIGTGEHDGFFHAFELTPISR